MFAFKFNVSSSRYSFVSKVFLCFRAICLFELSFVWKTCMHETLFSQVISWKDIMFANNIKVWAKKTFIRFLCQKDFLSSELLGNCLNILFIFSFVIMVFHTAFRRNSSNIVIVLPHYFWYRPYIVRFLKLEGFSLALSVSQVDTQCNHIK